MLIFGKIKHLAPLSIPKMSPSPSGWMRALLFFAVFMVAYVLLSIIYQQTLFVTKLPVLYAGAGIFALTALLTLPLFMKAIDKRKCVTLGFSWRNHSGDAGIGATAAALILSAGCLILVFNNNLVWSRGKATSSELMGGFIAMAVVAVAEEAVFRGYILGNLMRSFNRWVALVMSAGLFSFVHASNPGITGVALINVFTAGLLLGINFIYTRNLWFGVFFHLTWNFLQGPILGFNVSGLSHASLFNATITGNELLTGGSFGFEGSVLQNIFFAVCILLLIRQYENKPLSPK